MFWREWQTKSLGELLGGVIRRWWASLDTPDPWPDDVDAAVRAPDAMSCINSSARTCQAAIPEDIRSR